MPFDPEFKKHLHALLVEVSEEVADSEAKYKAELVWKAQQTHNGAAMPIAYKDAQLHALEVRVGKTIEKYIEAVSIWNIEITPAFETEMIQQFWMLTPGPNQVHFPPAINRLQTQAVQSAFSMERTRLAHKLVRQGTNRLRELKMKKKQAQPASDSRTYNISIGPGGRSYIDSHDNSTNIGTLTLSVLDDIDRLSEGHAALQSAAQEIRTAPIQSTSAMERFYKWAGLAIQIEGLVEKAHQHYPQLAHLLQQFRGH